MAKDQQTAKPKVMIWTEAVSASGHVRMSNKLSKALQSQGFDVVIATSEHAAKMVTDLDDFGDAELIALPSLKPKGEYDPENPESFFAAATPSGLDYQGDKAFIADRVQMLKDAYDRHAPDIVITEHWPIGRRKYDAEMQPFIEHIKTTETRTGEQPAKLVAYMRDATASPEMQAEGSIISSMLNQHFDAVLVRGDSRVISLNETLGNIPHDLEQKIYHVGYPACLPEPAHLPKESIRNQVVVSCGGGAQPDALGFYLNAIKARRFSNLADKTWHLFVNKECPENEFQAIMQAAECDGGKFIIERENASFAEHLNHCALAVIRGGMTVAEVAVAGKPAVIAPRIIYPDQPEACEQYMRAHAFSKRFSNMAMAMPRVLENPKLMGGLINEAYARRFDSQPQLLYNGQHHAGAVLKGVLNGERVQEPAATRERV